MSQSKKIVMIGKIFWGGILCFNTKKFKWQCFLSLKSYTLWIKITLFELRFLFTRKLSKHDHARLALSKAIYFKWGFQVWGRKNSPSWLYDPDPHIWPVQTELPARGNCFFKVSGIHHLYHDITQSISSRLADKKDKICQFESTNKEDNTNHFNKTGWRVAFHIETNLSIFIITWSVDESLLYKCH